MIEHRCRRHADGELELCHEVEARIVAVAERIAGGHFDSAATMIGLVVKTSEVCQAAAKIRDVET